MTRRLVGIFVLVATATLASRFTLAQAGPPGQGQPPAAGGGQPGPGGPGGGGGGRGGGAPALMDLATAKKAVDTAEAAATAGNARVAIAVVDANGDLVYFRRMDGAAAVAVTSSQGKARAAILFGMPTKAVADAAAAGTPVSATITPSGAGAFALQIQQGGIPIMKNGKVIGGIGAGGSAPANDEAFAKAGADAVK